MKSVIYLGIIIVFWLIIGESCLKFRTSDRKALKEFDTSGVMLSIKTLKVKDRTLHYVMTGIDTFPTIVFVHGSPGSWDAFKEYVKDKDLLKKFRMVSIDRPGFGYSDFGKSVNLQQESNIISPLFKGLKNNKPIYLVGHSLGGPMIVQLAADNPNTIAGLVILSGAIDVKLEKPEKWRHLIMQFPLRYLIPGSLRPSNNELWYLKTDLIKLAPRFKEITCPVYIIHGDKDLLVDYGNLAFGAKAFVNASKTDTLTIPGANHFIPWMHYDIIKKVLLRL